VLHVAAVYGQGFPGDGARSSYGLQLHPLVAFQSIAIWSDVGARPALHTAGPTPSAKLLVRLPFVSVASCTFHTSGGNRAWKHRASVAVERVDPLTYVSSNYSVNGLAADSNVRFKTSIPAWTSVSGRNTWLLIIAQYRQNSTSSQYYDVSRSSCTQIATEQSQSCIAQFIICT